jgi:hypothetical protein
MAGRVESDAGSFALPYEVLVGRDSDIIDKYQIVKLPRLIIVAQGGTISFTERFVPYDKLKEEVIKAEAKKPRPAKEVAKTKTKKPKPKAKAPTGTEPKPQPK